MSHPLLLAAEGKNGFLLPHDTNEIIWGSIAFLIVLGLLIKFAGPAIKNGLTSRTERLSKELDDAAAAKAEAQTKLAEVQHRIADAGNERQRILDEAEAVSPDRDEQIEAARRAYYEGFVAETIAAYTSGALTGSPALTRNRCGAGTAWYLSTRLDDEDHAALVAELLDSVGVGPVLAGLPPGVEAVTRDGAECRWHIVLNHRAEPVSLPRPVHDLLTGGPVEQVPAGGCVVLREGRPR